jgi:hypothetical protein
MGEDPIPKVAGLQALVDARRNGVPRWRIKCAQIRLVEIRWPIGGAGKRRDLRRDILYKKFVEPCMPFAPLDW